MQAYISDLLSAFFKTLQQDGAQKIDKINLEEISQKFLFWAEWVLWPKIMQTYISRSVLRIFSKLCSRTGHNNNNIKII